MCGAATSRQTPPSSRVSPPPSFCSASSSPRPASTSGAPKQLPASFIFKFLQILDVGCGDGAALVFIRKCPTVRKIVAVDVDEAALALAACRAVAPWEDVLKGRGMALTVEVLKGGWVGGGLTFLTGDVTADAYDEAVDCAVCLEL
jgi:SAM-dependent methyltransferase